MRQHMDDPGILTLGKRGLRRANSWCDGEVTERDQPPAASELHN